MSTALRVRSCFLIALALGGSCSAVALPAIAAGVKVDKIERGRYLVRLGGCNDCHSPGYSESGGKLPEAKWLLGSSLGYRGPWGTTYPANLRSYFSRVDEDQWVAAAGVMQSRPPMPSYTLHQISEADLRAMHAFVVSLGAGGTSAPEFLPPGKQATTPVIVLFPVSPQSPANGRSTQELLAFKPTMIYKTLPVSPRRAQSAAVNPDAFTIGRHMSYSAWIIRAASPGDSLLGSIMRVA
jgi:mono/diheme cytochrome c family protein